MTGPSAATLPRANTMQASRRLAGALAAIANVFERRTPHEHAATGEWAALCALVCIAAVLRFWGLGGHGLEYDEETMAMPVMHILERGIPVMPSGMPYVRGVAQLYLMAASVVAFGPTEWALRLPSAVCGVLLIVGSFFLGRRFLSPVWNIAFVGVIALSSTMILDAQEARMYVFMVTSLVWFNNLVFRWERTGNAASLCGAVIALVIGIQFHSLAIFGALPLLFPGLLHNDRQRLLQGAIALAIAAIAFVGIHHWMESFFPPHTPAPENAAIGVPSERHVYAVLAWQFWPISLLALAVIGVCVERLRRAVADRGSAWYVFALMGGALCAQWVVFYHLAAILYVAGLVVALRARTKWRAMLGVAVLSVGMLVFQVYTIAAMQPDSLHKLLGRLTGLPSIWPYLIFANYAPVAALIMLGGVATAMWQLSRRERLDAVWLYMALAVWAPLLLIGVFTWYPQQRYTEIALVPLYLCAVTILAAACKAIALRRRWLDAGLALTATLVIANPLATADVVNAGYRIHPDHKGAAEFVNSVRRPDDILLAEDVLQQTYYLGRVDYWLIGERTAQAFTRDTDGRRLDIYTHTPVLTNARELQALIATADRGAIYIIGSGEGQGDGRRQVRGASLAPLLERSAWPVVYRGRDGLTKVWRIPPLPAPAGAPAS